MSQIDYEYIPASANPGNGFHVYAQVAGGAVHNFQLDTGSSGMVVGSQNVGDVSNYPCFGPGQITYKPSNIVHYGTWYLLPIVLYSPGTNGGAGGATEIATSQCMVLVVAPDVNGNLYDGGMMGVSAKGENSAYNVLLNVSAGGSRLPAGYALTSSCVQLGQTYSGAGYEIVYLQPITPPPLPAQTNTPVVTPTVGQSWAMPTVVASFVLNSDLTVNALVTASFELDTGIETMLVVVPANTIPTKMLGPESPVNSGQYPFVDSPTGKDNVTITIFVSGTKQNLTLSSLLNAGILNYTFTTSNTQPPDTSMAPDSVILMPPPADQVGDMVRINVGIHPLRQNNYLYDAVNGIIGFASLST